jgi:acyl carrier protein
MDDIENYVFGLIRTVLPGNAGRPLDPGMDLVTDLGADSMSLVSIIFSLDEKFGSGGTAELGEMVQDCRTLGDLIAIARRLRDEHRRS